jgi:hypothetical protein
MKLFFIVELVSNDSNKNKLILKCKKELLLVEIFPFKLIVQFKEGKKLDKKVSFFIMHEALGVVAGLPFLPFVRLKAKSALFGHFLKQFSINIMIWPFFSLEKIASF